MEDLIYLCSGHQFAMCLWDKCQTVVPECAHCSELNFTLYQIKHFVSNSEVDITEHQANIGV